MKKHYVYGLFRPDTGAVFYIGMGQGDRALAHTKYRKRGRSYKDNLICKFLDDLNYSEVPVVIFRDNLRRIEAADLEIALIYAIGRHPHGPLTNIVRGGEGLADPTDTFRLEHGERMRKVLAQPAIRRKMSASAKSKRRDAEAEDKRCKRMSDPSVRAKMRAAKLGKPSAKRGRKFPSENVRLAQSKLGWITDDLTETKVNKNAPIPKGWRRGRLKTVSTEELQRRAEVQQEKREAWLYRNRDAFWITNGTGNKKIRTGTDIPNGWRKGKSNKPQSSLVL